MKCACRHSFVLDSKPQEHVSFFQKGRWKNLWRWDRVEIQNRDSIRSDWANNKILNEQYLFVFLQALWEEPVHAGRWGMRSGAKLHLLPLPVCGLEHVSPPSPLPGVGGSYAGRRAAFRPGGQPRAGPFQRAALRPANRHPPPGDAHQGSCHSGGRGGDERAGAPLPASPLPHQGHPVRFSVRVLGGGLMGEAGLRFVRVYQRLVPIFDSVIPVYRERKNQTNFYSLKSQKCILEVHT